MSRKLRVWFPGAIYHITCRGNRRASIFYDDHDRYKYLEILEDTKTFFPFTLHSYCLMPNHVHLQLETIKHHPKDIMRRLNMRYAIYFNKRHNLVGHLFQGRYHSELISSIKYLVDVSRYIHLNPVRAEIVSSPQDYKWSSYNAFITDLPHPHVNRSKILSYFPKPQKSQYRLFTEQEKNLFEMM